MFVLDKNDSFYVQGNNFKCFMGSSPRFPFNKKNLYSELSSKKPSELIVKIPTQKTQQQHRLVRIKQCIIFKKQQGKEVVVQRRKYALVRMERHKHLQNLFDNKVNQQGGVKK